MKQKLIVNSKEVIYKTSSKTEREKQLLNENKIISQKNKDFIIEFTNYKKFKGIGENRILKYFNRLRHIAIKLNKDFDEATKKDIDKRNNFRILQKFRASERLINY